MSADVGDPKRREKRVKVSRPNVSSANSHILSASSEVAGKLST
jgi:hypothetical protein